ncbi:tRNA (adenosine(37)-N6)-threonylcarbamoyltransferase complex dimerization subunit type 1 TsaB [Thiomicrorhabdus lithotrophica]|uniref:tRNA threonylcarbamoyladenosine biosynthesis protein TsaB n=1 Tax=Thiomicrorhabdus lithotrophica TaxID=2949997 RepID=A0ABY8CA48_9GAMM|nr:tRNA (adenosine(37)-N6)-threonylcarbamoyltransferase complex dimerization subunit type 1 TsaB [Thiomicrorhabdus lithotrophica]WEJ61560.1 tRNA (adenosine(37)-N6)-threonylcarbamoyltransferase complex dimerization subunit type 1 TsaB [Thiomicrorhabdus lithotrophica]
MSQPIFPTVLAVETATQACSVALIYKGQEFIRHEILPQKHAHRVLEMVDEVIAESGASSDEIDLLAYGEGPGAFTGVRIASGVIQGLALGWDKPVLAVSSLLAMAESVLIDRYSESDVNWCALLDARMKEIYLLVGTYQSADNLINSNEPVLIAPDAIGDYLDSSKTYIGIGDTQEEYPELNNSFVDWYSSLPSAVSIARLAQKKSAEAKSLDKAIPNPLYLRNQIADTIAERKLKKECKT